MVLTNEEIDAVLVDANLKITNAREDNKIFPLLQPFGYDENRFNEGNQLYQDAFSLHQDMKMEYGEQFLATETFQKEWEEVNKTYMQHVVLARVALKNHEPYLKVLGLLGERRNTYTGWIGMCNQFYKNVMKKQEVLDLLLNVGLTADMLTAAHQRVIDVENLKKMKSRETGDAQEATKLRDLAVEALREWIADLVAIARVALADSPQLLEKLDITVKN
jgi:hypothetical protein